MNAEEILSLFENAQKDRAFEELELLRQNVERNPSEKGFFGLAFLYEQFKEFDKALAAYRAALAIRSELHYGRGIARCLFRLGRPLTSLEILSETRHRDDPDSLYLIAVIQESLGRDAEAILALERAVERNPLFVAALLELSQILPRERSDAALTYLERALKIEPDNPDLLTEMGKRLSGFDRKDEAERFLKEALSIFPEHLWAHLYLGDLYARKGDDELAEKEMAIAHQIDASDFTAKQLKAISARRKRRQE